jgi:hypothetical protein
MNNSSPIPIRALEPSEENPIVDRLHVLIDGKPVRLFPGTGKRVSLDGLGTSVQWVGDSIGNDRAHIVDVVDELGNYAAASPQALMSHCVWQRIDERSRDRVLHWLMFARRYAVRIKTKANWPRFKVGEFVIADPSFTPGIGDDVIVVLRDGGVMVAGLRSQPAERIWFGTVGNQSRFLEIPAEQIASIHAVGEFGRELLASDMPLLDETASLEAAGGALNG